VQDDVQDEEMMRRFLLGQSGAEEQEAVEERFVTDPAFFEALSALEDELVLSHVRGDLPQRWRSAFDARVLASPARRRRVEEAERLHQALIASGARTIHSGHGSKRALWSRPTATWLAAAAAIVVVILSGWLIGRRTAPVQDAAVTGPATSSVPAIIATFVLAPGLTRSELGPSNVFRIEPGVQQVRIELSATTSNIEPLRAVLRQVGGEFIAVPTDPVFRGNRNRVDVSWLIAASLLPRGDYLLTLMSETPTGPREALASRFFSIVQ
jgi:hypothetical protein